MKPRILFIALSCAILAGAQSARMARQPYLQNTGETFTSILWTTSGAEGSGLVRVAGRDFRSRVLTVTPADSELPAPIFQHRADLTGLAPDSAYRYEVAVDGVVVHRGELRTAGASRYQFLALGDSGDGGQPQRQIAARMERESPAFVIHTGDIAYYDGRFEQYEALYFDVYRALMARVPFYPAAGNHDVSFRGGLAFRAVHWWPGHPRPYYSFDWGDVHFVALDTNQSLDAAVFDGGEMLRWLEQDLAATRKLFRVVFLHHPAFPTANYRGDERCRRVAENILPVLERGGVHLVLNGHEHLYQRTIPRNGIVYLTTGGGGSTVYPPGNDPFIAAGAGVSHYLRINVQPAELVAEAVNAAGEVIDTFRIRAAPDVSGVSNAAGAAWPAPGGLASVYGGNLVGATVRISGQTAPVLFDSWHQLNIQIPEVRAGDSMMTITGRGGETQQAIRVEERAPYIFRVAGGAAAITHADGRLVTGAHPALPGEWVSVYLTGLGRLPVIVRVTVDGQEAEVSFAGDSPGSIGLNQVNFQVPVGTAEGEQNLSLRAGSSEARAIIPIRRLN